MGHPVYIYNKTDAYKEKQTNKPQRKHEKGFKVGNADGNPMTCRRKRWFLFVRMRIVESAGTHDERGRALFHELRDWVGASAATHCQLQRVIFIRILNWGASIPGLY